MFTVEYFIDSAGHVVVDAWLEQLPDLQAMARIAARIERLERGAFGDCKPLREGVWEMRIDCGPGYRVYYSVVGTTVVLLLCGGNKRKQSADIERAVPHDSSVLPGGGNKRKQSADIERAVSYLKDYKRSKL